MNKNGDIIVIEDDEDDIMILDEIFTTVLEQNKYTNKIVILKDSTDVYDYLLSNKADPFLIISDINMPLLSGFALREQIKNNPELDKRTVPYIFLTTELDNPEHVKKAYTLSIQGYFTKPRDFNEFTELISTILLYWKTARIPPNMAS